MDILDSLQWRYACKKFDDSKTISTPQIERLCQAFNLTATSFGLQPIKLIVIKDRDLRKHLITHSYNQQQVWSASHPLVICIQDHFDATDIDAYFDLEREVRGTSETILEPYRKQVKSLFSGKSISEKHNSAINQAYIALGNLITICAIEKIDSCPMEGFDPDKYDEILALKQKNLKSVLLLPVGIRAEDDFMSTLEKVRKPLEESVINL